MMSFGFRSISRSVLRRSENAQISRTKSTTKPQISGTKVLQNLIAKVLQNLIALPSRGWSCCCVSICTSVPVKQVNFVPDRLAAVEALGLLLLGVCYPCVSIGTFVLVKQVRTCGHGGWNMAATCAKASTFALVKQVLLH